MAATVALYAAIKQKELIRKERQLIGEHRYLTAKRLLVGLGKLPTTLKSVLPVLLQAIVGGAMLREPCCGSLLLDRVPVQP
jgi:hypothetical protein